MLVVLALLHTKHRSNHVKDNITRKKIQSWIIDKNKNKINQVRILIKKTGSNKEKTDHQKKIVYQQTKWTKVFTS